MERLTPEMVREKGKDLVEEIEIIRDTSPIKLGYVKIIDADVKGNSVYVKLKADGKISRGVNLQQF